MKTRINTYKTAAMLAASAALLTLFPPAFCSADTTATPTMPVTLRYKFTEGQVLTYNMSTDVAVSVNGMSSAMHTGSQSTMIETVKSVAADGSGTVSMVASNQKMTMNGQPMSMPHMSALTDKLKNLMSDITMTISPSGKVVAMSFGGSLSRSVAGSAMGGSSALGEMAVLPTQAVKVGDIWRSSSTGAFGMDQYYKMALIGIQQIGGQNIAQIHFKVFGQTKPGGASVAKMKMDMEEQGTGETDFDIDAGNVKSSTITTTSRTTTSTSISGSNVGPIHSDMTMTIQIDRVDN